MTAVVAAGRRHLPRGWTDLGLQLTRTSRALKVWVSIQTFGLDAFRAAIRDRDVAHHTPGV